MALTAAHADLERRSGADLRDRLRAATRFAGLTSTAFTGTPVAGSSVQLVYPDNPASRDTAATVGTARDPSWVTATELGSELATMAIERNANDVTFLPYVDIESSPFDQIQAANQKMSHKMGITIDADLGAAFIAGVQTANTQTFGNATNYINAAGEITGDDANEFVVDAFISAAKWMLANNMIGTGERDYSVWAQVPGPLWGVWLNFIKDEKPSDSLFNLFVGPGSRHIAGSGREMGIRVDLNNRVPTAEVGTPAKTHAQILFGTDRAMSFGAAPPLMASVPATQNTSGKIGSSYGQAVWFGRHVLNPEQLRVARIRQEA